MIKDQAVNLKVGDMIKIRNRYGSNLAIVTSVRISFGCVWADYKWIGIPGGMAGNMESDLITIVNGLDDKLPPPSF